MDEMNEYGRAVYEIADWLEEYRKEGEGMGWLKPEQSLVLVEMMREFDRAFMYVYADYPINDSEKDD